MLSRAEFERLRARAAKKLAADAALKRAARQVMARAIPKQWIQQTTWLGEPVLQLPQDLFAIQEIVFATRPDYIVELGTAWAGSLLFYATLIQAIGGKGVIGVDVFVPADLRARLKAKGRVAKPVMLIEGSSTDPATLARIKRLTRGSRKVLVHLDSDHTAAHVARELALYAPLVGRGQYLICGDTHVENFPTGLHGEKPYRPGDSPKTALDAFLRGPAGRVFAVDRRFEEKYLFSLNPGGYLKRK